MALTYLAYLLRGVEFTGTLLENLYVASTGLDSAAIVGRFRLLPAVGFQRQGELVDFAWQYSGLEEWAEQSGTLRPSVPQREAS